MHACVNVFVLHAAAASSTSRVSDTEHRTMHTPPRRNTGKKQQIILRNTRPGMHACTHARKHARTPASTHAHTRARARTHTHTHTHTSRVIMGDALINQARKIQKAVANVYRTSDSGTTGLCDPVQKKNKSCCPSWGVFKFPLIFCHQPILRGAHIHSGITPGKTARIYGILGDNVLIGGCS